MNALLKVIDRRVQIPGAVKLKSQDKLVEYVNKFSTGEKNLIDYKSLVEDVQAFDYLAGASQGRSAATQKSGFTESDLWHEPKGIFEDDYIVLD